MNSANELTMLVDELAGHWTEPALEILKAAGIRAISVDMELEAWRTLTKILRSELRWQPAFRYSTLVSLSTVMEQVLRKAALLVADQFEPYTISYAFESRVRRLAGERRSSEVERRLYAEIVRQPVLRAAIVGSRASALCRDCSSAGVARGVQAAKPNGFHTAGPRFGRRRLTSKSVPAI